VERDRRKLKPLRPSSTFVLPPPQSTNDPQKKERPLFEQNRKGAEDEEEE
jgi:hypothetical protein